MIEEMFAVLKEMAARSTDHKPGKESWRTKRWEIAKKYDEKGGTRRKTKKFGCAITWQQKEGRKSGRTLGETLPWLSVGRRGRKRRRDQEERKPRERKIIFWMTNEEGKKEESSKAGEEDSSKQEAVWSQWRKTQNQEKAKSWIGGAWFHLGQWFVNNCGVILSFVLCCHSFGSGSADRP